MYRISIIFLGISLSISAIARDKVVYGYAEKATVINKNNLDLRAKLDTGAKTSSISAINITHFNRGGKKFLRFTVPSKKGNQQLECKYFGKTHIKLRADELEDDSDEAITTKRPMVLMRVKLGLREVEIPVNLADRRHFIYPLLLGRQAIVKFGGVVDPSTKYNMGK